tara:strand:+ start:79 stop:768 length:690 start_codon:yes stop_codon:yes gene_type:complete
MKICIITDERTGGTCFTEFFSCTSLNVLHDPQTRSQSRFNRDFKTTKQLMDFSFSYADVVKLCYHSFKVEKYREILDYCIEHNIHMVFLHREDIYKRSLSKCVALKLNNYGIYNENKETEPFNIDKNIYQNNLNNYNSHIQEHVSYLNKAKHPYYFIVYEELYTNNELIYKLFASLGLTIQNKLKLKQLLNADYKTDKKNELILNVNEIEIINKNYPKPILVVTYQIKL